MIGVSIVTGILICCCGVISVICVQRHNKNKRAKAEKESKDLELEARKKLEYIEANPDERPSELKMDHPNNIESF